MQKRRETETGCKDIVVAGALFALDHLNVTEEKITSVPIV